MEVVLWAVVIYLTGSITLAYFAYKTYRANPESEVNVNFTLMALTCFIWTFSEALYWTFEGLITLVIYHIKYVAIILLPYTILIVSLSVPIKRKIIKNNYMKYLLFIPQLLTCIFMITNPFHKMIFLYYTYNQGIGIRYTGEWGPLMWLYHIPLSYTYIFISVVVIIVGVVQSRLKTERIISVYLYACILAPIISNAVGITLHMNPDPTSLTVSISGIILLYTVSRYKIFTFEFKKETEIEEKCEVITGRSYMVRSRETAYRVFRAVASKNPGIIISHRIPAWIRINYGIIESPIIWLTETEHRYGIHPERIDFEIMYNISEFLRENQTGVVLIDGLYYLSLYHSQEKVLQFIKDVGDLCASYGGTYIVVNPNLEFFDDEQSQRINTIFEDTLPEPEEEPNLAEKGIYLIYSTHRDRVKFAYDIKDKNLFFVSTKNLHRFGIEKFLWLTNIGKGIPIEQFTFQGLEIIQNEVKNGYHIVLEGFEVLFSYFNEEEIFKIIKYISDLCAKNGVILILITAENSLSRRAKAFIEDLVDEIIVYETE